MKWPNFFAELKRRNVYKVAVAYLVAAWALIQAASMLLVTIFQTPPWVMKALVTALAVGFPVALVLSWTFEITPEGVKWTDQVAPKKSIARRTGRKLIGITVTLAAFAVTLFLLQLLHHASLRDEAASNNRDTKILPVVEKSAIPEKSIAVLPLVNSTGDSANEYFSDGMSEEFISSLSRLRELKVIGRTSSFQFKGETGDSKTIGEKLGVYYLLEGSVRKSADRVRIAVALIKSADGANVWSETYDRELKDIFAVQSEIAGAVAKQLKVALLGNNEHVAELATAATPSNQNVEAYNALLQGNFYLNRSTADDLRKAIGYYEEAIRLDPHYALAYAKLVPAAVNLITTFGPTTKPERETLITKAREAAKTALALDPNLAEAHSGQGTILERVDVNFGEAETEHRRALELAPQNPAVTRSLAVVLAELGRLDEAVTLQQRAITLDPLRTAAYFNLATYLVPLGRYDEAEAALAKAISLQPRSAQNYMWQAVIQILRGKPGTAVELAKQETDPFWRTYAIALAEFANGNQTEADSALKKLIDEDAEDGASQIAEVYALRKEPEKMFEWLERAWTTHDSGVLQLLADPFLRVYKDDPRYIGFAQKIGLMPKPAAR